MAYRAEKELASRPNSLELDLALVFELLDQALSLESWPFRGSQVRKRPGYLKKENKVADYVFVIAGPGAAPQAAPQAVRWANSGSGVTLEQLEVDIATLAKAQAEYKTEAARAYDFTPASPARSTMDLETVETDLVEQPA